MTPGFFRKPALTRKRSLLILACCWLWWQVPISIALSVGPDLVLVASNTSTIAPLTADEVRKLYLGIPIFNNGQTIKPLLNHSDGYLKEVFMQKVMFMSTPAYERQILSRVFRMGGNRPPVYTGLHTLLSALKDDPSTLSYMYSDEASAHPELKIVSTLWEEQD
ncbi:MAG: hypothetical protein Q7S51_01665 [Gallionellaceae bacterium]|nr:hypothetical protein [Gallionellaceae bacterium]